MPKVPESRRGLESSAGELDSRHARVSRRARVLLACAALVVALLAVAAFAPLPFSVAQPGTTVERSRRRPGQPGDHDLRDATTRETSGQLRMTTIEATGPDATVRLGDVIDGWFGTDRAVMPRDSVYPVGDSTKEIEKHNTEEMEESQNTATSAALGYCTRSADTVKVKLRLADVGGPSAGLLFSLGIVDKLDGDGHGGDLTGGRTIAGTGTIDGGRQGRRGRRGRAQDAGRQAGRGDGLPGPQGGVLGREVGAAQGAAADPRDHPQGRGGGASGAGVRQAGPQLLSARPAGRPWGREL